MHDHDQAAHWYRKAAEQGGKTGLKRLGYSLLLIGIATMTGYAQETAGEYVSPSRAVPKATAPRMQMQIAQQRRTDELAKVARCRHVVTDLFSSGYAGLGFYSCHHDDNF